MKRATPKTGLAKPVMSPFVQPHLDGRQFKKTQSEAQRLYGTSTPSSVKSTPKHFRTRSAKQSSGSPNRRTNRSSQKSLNHSVERMSLVPSKSASQLKKQRATGQITAVEYQMKTFAAEIDKKFLHGESGGGGGQVPFQSDDASLLAVEEYALTPTPGIASATESKQQSEEEDSDDDEEVRIEIPGKEPTQSVPARSTLVQPAVLTSESQGNNNGYKFTLVNPGELTDGSLSNPATASASVRSAACSEPDLDTASKDEVIAFYERRIGQIRDQHQLEMQQIKVRNQETMLQLQLRLSQTTANLQSFQDAQLEATELKLALKRATQGQEREKNEKAVLERAFDDLKSHGVEVEKVALAYHANLQQQKQVEADLISQLQSQRNQTVTIQNYQSRSEIAYEGRIKKMQEEQDALNHRVLLSQEQVRVLEAQLSSLEQDLNSVKTRQNSQQSSSRHFGVNKVKQAATAHVSRNNSQHGRRNGSNEMSTLLQHQTQASLRPLQSHRVSYHATPLDSRKSSQQYPLHFLPATQRFRQLDESDSSQVVSSSNQIRQMNNAATASLVKQDEPEETVHWPSQHNDDNNADIQRLEEPEMEELSRRVIKMAIKRQQNKFRQESSQVKSILSWGDQDNGRNGSQMSGRAWSPTEIKRVTSNQRSTSMSKSFRRSPQMQRQPRKQPESRPIGGPTYSLQELNRHLTELCLRKQSLEGEYGRLQNSSSFQGGRQKSHSRREVSELRSQLEVGMSDNETRIKEVRAQILAAKNHKFMYIGRRGTTN